MQTITRHLFSDRKRLILCGLLILSILTGTFAMIGHLRPFHASAAANPTCAQAPTAKHCNNQDPEVQECAEANAATIAQADIVENGVTIGRVERRFSDKCASWWGRVFDYRQGSHANMFITIAGVTLSAAPTFVSTPYRILYSQMVFEASPTQTVPAITGSLTIDGITPPATATIPEIVIPTH